MHTHVEPDRAGEPQPGRGATRSVGDTISVGRSVSGVLSATWLRALQRTAGNAAVARMVEDNGHVHRGSGGHAQPVQRFTEERGGNLGMLRKSANSLYVLPGRTESDANWVWVHPEAPAPRYCQATGRTTTIKGVTYNVYQPTALFLEDCLHTAEEVMHQQTLRGGQDASQTAAGRPFGISDAANVEAARHYAANRPDGRAPGDDGGERPIPGQAFAIVETNWSTNPPGPDDVPLGSRGFPYHAAAVVAVDGDDQLTLEQTAGSTDAQAGQGARGIFDMYMAGQAGGAPLPRSFHGRHADSFTKGAITITLAPINVRRLKKDVPRTETT
jgi:hypothetical protein